jgi:hypothetical protein
LAVGKGQLPLGNHRLSDLNLERDRNKLEYVAST